MPFKDYKLSRETLAGLKAAGYKEPTEIQKQTLQLALDGKDVLGSAKTGSGKTLAFILPLLECLNKEKWTNCDGLGALVITPTRELAYQIFEVLRLVGQHHQFSAALIIGGKDLALERKRIDQMNIIICTPGRMQQHMEENPLFHADNLKILIIDEADRILDMGFKESLSIILDFLPRERQCLLFSATQTRSVDDLARLSLNNPHKVSVDETAETSTPDTLRQKYTVINLEQKLSFLWSFIKKHKKSKILVFIATCKQTKFIFDLFCRMKPGTSINALYGGLHQHKRMDVYNKFRDVKHCVLFATDVAARGLDFPEVHWVVQLDCPEDATTYIHRVGRTARADRPGRSIMVLMPNEKDYMVAQLEKNKIQVDEIPTTEKHLMSIENSVSSTLARDVELKEEAKRAFKCYIKSLLNSRFRKISDPTRLNLEAFARSLGLEVTPRIRVLERRGAPVKVDYKQAYFEDNDDDDESDEEFLKPVKKLKTDDDEDFLKLPITTDTKLSKGKLARKLLKKNIRVNQHIKFTN